MSDSDLGPFAAVLQVERFMGAVGLNSPMRRMLFFSSLGTGLEFYLKPSYAFNNDGTMKSIAYLTGDAGATYIPPGLIPLVVGLVASLYI